MVHRVALDLSTWHLTMPILAPPELEGRFGQVGLGVYAQWFHGHTFVSAVLQPWSVAERHAVPFRRWANKMGVVLDWESPPYLQLAPISLSQPTFLQSCLKAYSVVP